MKKEKNVKKPTKIHIKTNRNVRKSQQQCETAKKTTEKCRKKVKNIKKH